MRLPGACLIKLFAVVIDSVALQAGLMEQRALKNVNNCLNTDIYSYLVTTGG